jgi:hypothetical protein
MIAMVLATFPALLVLLINIKARAICPAYAIFLAICITLVAVSRTVIGAARLVAYKI